MSNQNNTTTPKRDERAADSALSASPGSPRLSEADRSRLDALFLAGWEKTPADDEHWIHGVSEDYDEGLSYCYECAEKEIEKLQKEKPEGEWILDGGWGSEGDSTPFCEQCGKLLSNTLTAYGCEEEVDHFLRDGFDPKSDDDCRSMYEVISALGWDAGEIEKYREYVDRLHTLGRAILSKLGQENNEG